MAKALYPSREGTSFDSPPLEARGKYWQKDDVCRGEKGPSNKQLFILMDFVHMVRSLGKKKLQTAGNSGNQS